MKAAIGVIKYVALPLVGLSVVLSASIRLYPPVAAGVLALLGRSNGCGVVGTFAASRRLYRDNARLLARYHRSARIIQTDARARLQFVETLNGRYWEPIVEGSVVTAQLSELRAKYSGMGGPEIGSGDVVIDCGANVGVFTREALSRGAALVVAVEPAPENVECLRRNFASEVSSQRVILCEKGVWDKQEVLHLRQSDSTSAMDSFVEREHTREGPLIPLTTIDLLVEELKLSRVDFIKMDIEGAERRALTGARGTLARHHPVLEVSVNHLPDDPEVITGIVRGVWSGYRSECLFCSLEPMRLRARPGILYFHR